MAIVYPGALDSFTTKYDNLDDVMAVDVNDLSRAIEKLEEKVGINSSADTASIDYKVNNFFATGRKLWLYENTAPTGWSIVAVSDISLAVKGGAGAYNVTGGNIAGAAWATLKAHVHTGPNHNHTLSHYHAAPAHLHKWYEGNADYAADKTYDASGAEINIATGVFKGNYESIGIVPTQSDYTAFLADAYTSMAAAANTGYNSHDSGYSGTGNTGAQDTADVRPTAAVGIIVTKT